MQLPDPLSAYLEASARAAAAAVANGKMAAARRLLEDALRAVDRAVVALAPGAAPQASGAGLNVRGPSRMPPR